MKTKRGKVGTPSISYYRDNPVFTDALKYPRCWIALAIMDGLSNAARGAGTSTGEIWNSKTIERTQCVWAENIELEAMREDPNYDLLDVMSGVRLGRNTHSSKGY